jgi:hypothetical protein
MTQLITVETLKTIGQGALGAMTFGAYHQYTTNKIMELNNEKMEIQHKYFMDKMEEQHKREMNETNEKLNKLEKMMSSQTERRTRWW